MINENNLLASNNKSFYRKKYLILKTFMNQEPYDFCLNHINQRVADVLKGVLDQSAIDFFKGVNHRKDNRTNIQFAQDLVMSRVLEVYVINYFKDKYDREYRLNGCDKEDVLDTKGRITTDPDLITKKGSLIEVVSDKFGFWKKNNGFDLRDNKFLELKTLSEKTDVYILAIDITEKRYQFIKIDADLKIERVEKIKEFGNKDGYHIIINEENYKRF